MITFADAVAVLEILNSGEDPIWVHGNQTTVDALYDSNSIGKYQDATRVEFEFYASNPRTGFPTRVRGNLYSMVFDRITFTQ